MLIVLIIIAFICYIAGYFINGFTLYNLLLLIPTIMFAVRKSGIHVKLSSICVVEALFLFFDATYRLIFNRMNVAHFLLEILMRAIFLIIVIYDDANYVYVSEEVKRNDRKTDWDS